MGHSARGRRNVSARSQGLPAMPSMVGLRGLAKPSQILPSSPRIRLSG